MQLVNRYYKSAKISEVKFRYLLRLFALDLTASDTARLTGLSKRTLGQRDLPTPTPPHADRIPRAGRASRSRRVGRMLLRYAAGAGQAGLGSGR